MSYNEPSVHLQLPRPQYVPLPEAFISALAWRAFHADVRSEDGRVVGLRYWTRQTGTSQISYRATAPSGAQLAAFGSALEDAGIQGEASNQDLGLAVTNSVKGVQSKKGDSQAASPLTPALAMLQTVAGLQGAARPPDLGEIIEVLYQLGGDGQSDCSDSATARWLAATERRMQVDPLLRAVDTAIDGRFLDGPRVFKAGSLSPKRAVAHGDMSRTPFEWFRQSWDRLTSDEWVDALPARVWVDWATTVLRLGYGLGYLWESAWYDTLARKIVEVERSVLSWKGVRDAMPTLIPWRSSRKGPQSRDVASLLSWRSYQADQIRHQLDSWLDDNGAGHKGFEAVTLAMQEDTELVDQLAASLRSKLQPRSGKNLWEASIYALQTRMVGGPNADYYGLLSRSGRFVTPDPGTEWIAVVASLACGRPGASASIATVLQSLSSLGVRPELPDLVSLLERAGLARGSADADQGVIVQSAF